MALAFFAFLSSFLAVLISWAGGGLTGPSRRSFLTNSSETLEISSSDMAWFGVVLVMSLGIEATTRSESPSSSATRCWLSLNCFPTKVPTEKESSERKNTSTSLMRVSALEPPFG